MAYQNQVSIFSLSRPELSIIRQVRIPLNRLRFFYNDKLNHLSSGIAWKLDFRNQMRQVRDKQEAKQNKLLGKPLKRKDLNSLNVILSKKIGIGKVCRSRDLPQGTSIQEKRNE